ncbi:hypothetical protein BFP77_08325 [Maribacter sp. 4U21]|uniref:M15 family metallopeptidase n=1 Tax=Maribacter sp. 4U21 TaxID=1889779 RepID=UPI000C144EF3|nr:M15 family metallopeptidase [Maribacter sp. 4U21]PIB28913.1 hypothetical protein BFP77_08325 [Maribacter sp. 4U21]
MKLSTKQQIFTLNIAKLILKANEMGILLTFGDAFRTQDQQYLYYKGLTFIKGMLAKVSRKSWTMDGQHLKRLAVDFNHFLNGGADLTYKKEYLQELGDYWESLHPDNRWGGNFKKTIDTPHYEMRD